MRRRRRARTSTANARTRRPGGDDQPPADELYAYWRDFANLPTFMDNVVRIDVLDDTRSHWVVKAPGGKTVEWDARDHRGARRTS